MPKIDRSDWAHYLNVLPSGVADYVRIGEGVPDATLNMNPKTTEETYISDKSATITVDGYAPTMPFDMVAISGDDVYDFILALYKARAKLDAAETDIINVDLYATPAVGEYPAEKQNVAVTVDTKGGPGGAPNRIAYTVHYQGDPIDGTFNPTTLAFTPTV
ncbi:MAG: hypothetical protein WAV13_00375 [Thermodesulfovibrionales bacterium]